MQPHRYRCALIPALLVGIATLAYPQTASAQGAFKGGMRSARQDVADPIDAGAEQNRPRADNRRLEDAPRNHVGALDDRRHQGSFGKGMHHLDGAQARQQDGQQSPSDVRASDKAGQGLHDRDPNQSRFAKGARYLSDPAGNKMQDKTTIDQPAARKGIGDKTGQRDEKANVGANAGGIDNSASKNPAGKQAGLGGGMKLNFDHVQANPTAKNSGLASKEAPRSMDKSASKNPAGKQAGLAGGMKLNFDHIQANPAPKHSGATSKDASSSVGGLAGKRTNAAANAKQGPKDGAMTGNAKNASGNQKPANVKHTGGATAQLGQAKSEPGNLAKHKGQHPPMQDTQNRANPMPTPKQNASKQNHVATSTGGLVGAKAAQKNLHAKSATTAPQQHAGKAQQPGQLVGAKAAQKQGAGKQSPNRQNVAAHVTSKTGTNTAIAKTAPGNQAAKQKSTGNNALTRAPVKTSPVNLVGNMTGARNSAVNRTTLGNQAAFKQAPRQGSMPAVAKHAPSNINAGRKK